MSWNVEHLRPYLSQDQELLISAIPIAGPNIQYSIVRPYTNSEVFTVKSGYHYLHDKSQLGSIQHPHNSHIIPPIIWNWIWKLHSIPRIKNFLWWACLGILPSKANLFRRQSTPSAECQIYLHSSETTEHALLACPWAISAWFAHPLSYKVPLQEITSFDDWFHSVSLIKTPIHFTTQNHILALENLEAPLWLFFQ